MITSIADDDQLAIVELARGMGLDLLYPVAREAEEARRIPDRVWSLLLNSGLVAPIPEELGGGGIPDAQTQLCAIEHLAYGDVGITLGAMWSGAAALLLAVHGSADQRNRAGALANNPQARGAVALYEGHGRAPSEFATMIRATGDGTLHISGRKVAVPFASVADPMVVVGIDPTNGELRAALVPADGQGVRVEPSSGGLALDAAATCSVSFDVTVPAENLVEGSTLSPMSLASTVSRIRLFSAAAQVGAAQRALDYAASYATERVAFGRPISGFQGVSFPLAEAQTSVMQARLELADVGALLRDGGDAHEEAVTHVVNHCADVGSEATRTAVQTLGGHGFITDHPTELWYRSTAALSTYDFDPLCSSIRTAF